MNDTLIPSAVTSATDLAPEPVKVLGFFSLSPSPADNAVLAFFVKNERVVVNVAYPGLPDFQMDAPMEKLGDCHVLHAAWVLTSMSRKLLAALTPEQRMSIMHMVEAGEAEEAALDDAQVMSF